MPDTPMNSAVEDSNAIVRTTIEEIPGWVITTTTRIERRTSDRRASDSQNNPHPNTHPNTQPPPVSPEHPPVNWDALPPGPVLPTPQCPDHYSKAVPHPTELQIRDGMQNHQGKFYTIFRGREVGIFYDAITEVNPRVSGVPKALSKGYKTWEEAVSEYARAYAGMKQGWEIAVINPPSVAFPLEGEQWESIRPVVMISDSDED